MAWDSTLSRQLHAAFHEGKIDEFIADGAVNTTPPR